MKSYNLELTDKDIEKIMGALDLAVKQIGLNSMELIMLASKIDNQKKEKDKDGV